MTLFRSVFIMIYDYYRWFLIDVFDRCLGRRFTIMGFVVTSTIVVFMADALRSISF